MFIHKEHLYDPIIRKAIPAVLNNYTFDPKQKSNFIRKLIKAQEELKNISQEELDSISEDLNANVENPEDLSSTHKISIPIDSYDELIKLAEASINPQTLKEKFSPPPSDAPSPRRPLVH